MADWHNFIEQLLKDVVLVGGAIMAILYGLKRVYNTARTIEKVLESSTALSSRLEEHIKMEEDRDEMRDKQFTSMQTDIQEITREIRPNGGSSMKDVINQTNDRVHDIHTRVSILEAKEIKTHA